LLKQVFINGMVSNSFRLILLVGRMPKLPTEKAYSEEQPVPINQATKKMDNVQNNSRA
jgi:hypothetical protein